MAEKVMENAAKQPSSHQQQTTTPPKDQQQSSPPQWPAPGAPASPPQIVEEPPTPTPIALQAPPPPRTKGQPLQVPQGQEPHHRLKQRRASDVIDSGGGSPVGSPGAAGLYLRGGSSLPREFGHFLPPRSPLSPTSPMGLGPRSPASDRGYGGSSSFSSSFSSPVTPVRDATDAARDASDAAPMGNKPVDVDPNSITNVQEAFASVEKDAEEYNMRHIRRGRAVIFNNDIFEMSGFLPRAGSDVDVKNLKKSFETLQFEVEVHDNKPYGEIREIVSQLALENHSDADCIAIAVLTHGIERGYLLARDLPYPVETLWEPFTADRCLTLAGKPKLFFIQACRGDKIDAGVTLRHRSRTETDSGRSSYKIPTHSDFLMAYSAPAGFFSWRNPEHGTWFIQCLCQELNENAQSMDMLRLLTRVARRVALDYESFNDLVPWENQCKIVPSFTSMLIRDLIFHPKV